MNKLDLHKRFINGMLRLHGVTLEELNERWRYGGGLEGHHNSYFQLLCKTRMKRGEPVYTRPEYRCHCVCGHEIVENCYITDCERFVVVGNCCIIKFMGEKKGRTCERCGKPHRNIVVNRCNDCRVGVCDNCDESCPPKKRGVCHDCKKGFKRPCEKCGKLHLNKIVNRCDTCRIGVCDTCGKGCRPCFERCYACEYGGVCKQCGKKCKQNFEMCYTCAHVVT